MSDDLKQKKRLVVVVYLVVFVSIFAAATYTAIHRRIQDAEHAGEAAPVGSR